MRALVTGAGGFIGSNLAEYLLNKGTVLGLDLKYPSPTYPDRGIDACSLDVSEINRHVSGEGLDVVFHQASCSSAPYFHPRNGFYTTGWRTNVQGFAEILEFARKWDIPSVVYASTASLYNQAPTPNKESYVPTDPRTFYESSKLNNEHLAKNFWEMYGVKTVGLRYFSVYGSHEEHKGDSKNLLTKIVLSSLNKTPFQIYGDGRQKRDFVHVFDVAKANWLAHKHGRGGQVYNVGTGIGTSLNELVSVAKTVLPYFDAVKIKNPVKNYVKAIQADTKKIRTELKWKPEISLREGIKMNHEYYAGLLK